MEKTTNQKDKNCNLPFWFVRGLVNIPNAFGINTFLKLWDDKSSIEKPGYGNKITNLANWKTRMNLQYYTTFNY